MNNGWSETEGALTRTYTFSDFKQALAFVNSVGEIAEKLGHHPDLCIRGYKNVVISTTTHDAQNTVTQKDRELTAAIDALSPTWVE